MSAHYFIRSLLYLHSFKWVRKTHVCLFQDEEQQTTDNCTTNSCVCSYSYEVNELENDVQQSKTQTICVKINEIKKRNTYLIYVARNLGENEGEKKNVNSSQQTIQLLNFNPYAVRGSFNWLLFLEYHTLFQVCWMANLFVHIVNVLQNSTHMPSE